MNHFDTLMSLAAKQAAGAVSRTMKMYRVGNITDEEELTGALVGRLSEALESNIGGVKWSASTLRHRRGSASEENLIGADLMMHVNLDIDGFSYSKGLLIQSKRLERETLMTDKSHKDLKLQCEKMLTVTPDSYIFDYTKKGMRCGSATRVLGSDNKKLYDDCIWTPYRFFFEFFRCSIGDPKLKGPKISDIPAPLLLKIKARDN